MKLSWSLPESIKPITFFCVLLPVALGLVLGMLQANYGREFPRPVALTIWPLSQVMVWISFGLGTWLVCRLFANVKSMPFWLLLGLGALLGKVATWPLRAYVINGLLAWHGHAPIDADLLANSSAPLDTLAAIGAIAELYVIPIALWLGAHYLLLYLWGPKYFRCAVPVEGIPGDDEVSPEDATEPLATTSGEDSVRRSHGGVFAEIPDYNGEPIICASSEGNYVHLHSSDRDWMVRYTFGTALEELGANATGNQVHRGFWVRDSAVKRVSRRGRVYSLELENGMTVPVARAYSDIARKLRLALH